MTKQHASLLLTTAQLWQFSLNYYGIREVKTACLNLQNQFNGNVNLLLLLAWLDQHQLTIQAEDWVSLENTLDHSESLLLPYRELRRKLKNHVSEPLYREALEFELQLEQRQQSDLVEHINTLTLYSATEKPLTQQYCLKLGCEHLFTSFETSAEQLKMK